MEPVQLNEGIDLVGVEKVIIQVKAAEEVVAALAIHADGEAGGVQEIHTAETRSPKILGEPGLQAEPLDVPAMEDVITAGRGLVHEDRPNLRERAWIFEVKRIRDRRNKIIEAVIALEKIAVAGGHGLAAVVEKLPALTPERAAVAGTYGSIIDDDAGIVALFRSCREATGWRRQCGAGLIRHLAANDWTCQGPSRRFVGYGND